MRRIYSRAPSFFITRGDSICHHYTCWCRHGYLYHTSAIPHPFRCAAAAVQLYNAVYRYHTPHFTTPHNTRCGCSFVLSHPLIYHTLFLFITPPNTRCGCPDALSHPHFYHTPWDGHASCTLSPGVHNITHPPQYNTPGDNIFKPQNVITGVSYIVSDTVLRRCIHPNFTAARCGQILAY